VIYGPLFSKRAITFFDCHTAPAIGIAGMYDF